MKIVMVRRTSAHVVTKFLLTLGITYARVEPRSAEGVRARWRFPYLLFAGSIFICATLVGPYALAAPGDLDPRFGNMGRVERRVGANLNLVVVMTLLRSASQTLVAFGNYQGGSGSSNFAVGQSPLGFADPQFGTDGLAALGPSVGSVSVALAQRDGKFLLIGTERRYTNPQTSAVFVERIDAQGRLDPTFGVSGIRYLEFDQDAGVMPGAAVMQSDGRFVVQVSREQTSSLVLRFMPDGMLDPTFGIDGVATLPAALDTWGYGSIVMQGSNFVVAGTADVSVAQLGYQIPAYALARLTTNGSVEMAFGRNGGILHTYIPAAPKPNVIPGFRSWLPVALQALPDAKLLLATTTPYTTPYSWDFGVPNPPPTFSTPGFIIARLLPDGAYDPSFGTRGVASTPIDLVNLQANALLVYPDGRFVVGGYGLRGNSPYSANPYSAIARQLSDGMPDPAFGANGVSLVAGTASGDTGVSALLLEPTSRLIATVGGRGRLEYLAIQGDDTIPVIEFYHAGLDHYFITSDPAEVRDLDTGVHTGWSRTGYSFGARPTVAADVTPVCRYYIPPTLGDSHFFSGSPSECAAIAARIGVDPNYAGYVLESSPAFYEHAPNIFTGTCAEGTTPVYRLWNGRADSNHRYTTSVAVKAQMVARGYIPEGYGPNAVAMCAG
jgi:uncharacterized delta-60 repeat protein